MTVLRALGDRRTAPVDRLHGKAVMTGRLQSRFMPGCSLAVSQGDERTC